MVRTPLRALLVPLFVVAALVASAPAADAACANADLTYSGSNLAAVDEAVTCLVNAERTARGLPALKRDSRLDAAAQGHSADMAQHDYFDHDSQNGDSFSDRITAAGYTWMAAGENIAAGTRTAKSTMLMWLASKGHCQNILSGAYGDIGVGTASGGSYGTYWTQDFARQSGAGQSSTAASGCPFTGLVSGGPSGAAPDGSQSCSPTSLKLTSLRRSGSRLRLAGRIGSAGCCPEAHFTVRRGVRKSSSTRTICGQTFVVKLKLPRTRGNARVTVRLGENGPSARRALKL